MIREVNYRLFVSSEINDEHIRHFHVTLYPALLSLDFLFYHLKTEYNKFLLGFTHRFISNTENNVPLICSFYFLLSIIARSPPST